MYLLQNQDLILNVLQISDFDLDATEMIPWTSGIRENSQNWR